MQIQKTLFFVGLLCASFNAAWAASNYNADTLFFEHWRHYDSQGIACAMCHKLSETGQYSLPDHKVCQYCHKPGRANDYETSTKPICDKCHPKNREGSVQRLRRLKRVGARFFSHSETLENLCDVCHGRMLEDVIAMGTLLTDPAERIRIRQKGHYFYAKGTCDNCHKGFSRQTVPANHSDDWDKKHAIIAPQFNCRICHTKNFCQDCHESSY